MVSTTRPPRDPRLRSSVIILVMVMMIFAATAITAFMEKASNDLLVNVRQEDARRLRQEAFSAVEVTLAVLEDFRQADSGLHSPAEGWNNPLAWAGWEPSHGRKVDITFEDESAKIPIKRADLTTLTNLFENWQMAPNDAEKLADAVEGWMQSGYTYSTGITPDYDNGTIPFAEPERPMRTFNELASIYYAKDVFFDQNGLPNEYYWRFVSDISLFNFSQPNANTANPDVMAAAGLYTDAQTQRISDFLSGSGQFASQGNSWFSNGTTLATVAGAGGNAGAFGTTITALRINVTVHEGSSEYHLSVVVAPQGGATMNTTNATNPNAPPATASTAATPNSATSATNTSQPSSTATSTATSAAASQTINYPFTVLQLQENDQIPQPPPPPPPTQS